MPSSLDPLAAVNSRPPARQSGRFQQWNRKWHTYLGLYLLFFIWLFSFSGLLLNHSQWKFAEFWSNRKETTVIRAITAPAARGDLAQACDLMRQLGIQGEIEWTITPANPNTLLFRVTRPGRIDEINADFAQQQATIKRQDVNTWGILRSLHAFTGVRQNDARNRRDWLLTAIWAWSMDAVAVGLVALVVSSWVMWFGLPQRRRSGAVVLALGFLSSGLFWMGWSWVY